jgi:hypothetical protein
LVAALFEDSDLADIPLQQHLFDESKTDAK